MQESGVLHRVKFLLLLFFISTFLIILWGWVSILFYVETGIIPILSGYLCGIITSVYFRKVNKRFFLFSGLFFCFFTVFMGQYVNYAYLYEEGLILASEQSKLNIAFKTITSLSFEKFSHFFKHYITESGFLELIWIILAVVSYFYQLRKIPYYQKKEYEIKKFFRGNSTNT